MDQSKNSSGLAVWAGSKLVATALLKPVNLSARTRVTWAGSVGGLVSEYANPIDAWVAVLRDVEQVHPEQPFFSKLTPAAGAALHRRLGVIEAACWLTGSSLRPLTSASSWRATLRGQGFAIPTKGSALIKRAVTLAVHEVARREGWAVADLCIDQLEAIAIGYHVAVKKRWLLPKSGQASLL